MHTHSAINIVIKRVNKKLSKHKIELHGSSIARTNKDIINECKIMNKIFSLNPPNGMYM